MTFDPIETLNITMDYHGLDQFGKYSFNITKSQYDNLNSLFKAYGVKYLPITKFEFKDKMYYSFKVKSTAVFEGFNEKKLKGKKVKCSVDFYEWDYMNKQGIRATIERLKVLGDSDKQSVDKDTEKKERTYKDLDEIDEAIDLPKILGE